jgi:hypothetical protein
VILGVLAKAVWKVAVGLVSPFFRLSVSPFFSLSVSPFFRLSVRTEDLGYHLEDFCNISNWRLFNKICRQILTFVEFARKQK